MEIFHNATYSPALSKHRKKWAYFQWMSNDIGLKLEYSSVPQKWEFLTEMRGANNCPHPPSINPLFVKKKGANIGHSHFYETSSMIQDTTVFEIFRSELWFLQKIYYRKISRPVTLRLNYLDLFQQKWPFLRLFVFHFAAIAFKSGWKSYSPKRSMRWSFPLRLSKSCAVQKSLAYHKIPCTLDERDNLFSGKKEMLVTKNVVVVVPIP